MKFKTDLDIKELRAYVFSFFIIFVFIFILLLLLSVFFSKKTPSLELFFELSKMTFVCIFVAFSWAAVTLFLLGNKN